MAITLKVCKVKVYNDKPFNTKPSKFYSMTIIEVFSLQTFLSFPLYIHNTQLIAKSSSFIYTCKKENKTILHYYIVTYGEILLADFAHFYTLIKSIHGEFTE